MTASAVRIVKERPPLGEGKVYLDYGERATISENLEAAYVALNEAFRGIWIEKALNTSRSAGRPRRPVRVARPRRRRRRGIPFVRLAELLAALLI